MAGSPKRSREDDIAQALIANGKILVRTGTPVEELTLAAAAELASRQKNATLAATLSQSRIYSRFRDPAAFRMAVLEGLLEDSPPYSDLALDGLMQAIQQVGHGKSEVIRPEDVPELIAKVAAEHEEEMRKDSEVALRLYALWRLTMDSSGDAQEKLGEVRQRDETINEEWARIFATLAAELGAAPVSDTNYSEFEIALTALRVGLLVRQMTTDIPDGLLERVVGALIVGLFAEKEEAEKTTVAARLREFLAAPKMRKHQKNALSRATIERLAAESLRRLSGISDEDVDAASNPAVRRALEALRERGGRL